MKWTIGKGLSPLLGRGGGTSWSSYWLTLISATVENAAPTNVVLTFPSAQTSLGATDFTIAGFTISSASWVGDVLTLVLTSAVAYDDTLTVTFVKSGGTHAITNNITHPLLIVDGNSVAWYKPSESANVTASAGVESIWWDMLYGKHGVLGNEQNSGVIVVYAVYKITATQTNFFYTGCAIGDVFVCGTVKTCDANNKVQRYTGNHITQPTSTNRPTNQIFDGSDNFMCTPPFSFESPITLYAVIKQISWTDNDYLIDGLTVNNLKLAQSGVTPRLSATAAAILSDNLPISNWGIIRLKQVGNTKTLIIDDNTATTANIVGYNSPGGIVLGTRGNLPGALYGNFAVREIIARQADDDATNQAIIYSYLKRKYHDDLITEAWILIGQSNAIGNCLVAEQTIPGYNAVLTKGRIWNPNSNAIELLTPGTNSAFNYPEDTAIPNYFGSEVAFLKDLSLDKNIDQVVIKLVEGSTQLKANAGVDWSETSSAEMYDALKGHINDCNAYITSKGRFMRIRGIIWVHGESDIDHPIEYGTLLVPFFSSLITFCDGINSTNGVPYKEIIKIIPRLSASMAYNAALLAQMRTAQSDFITNYGGILIDTDGFELKVDNIHYSADGQITMGQAIAMAVSAIY
jgi:hypothetical protein